MEKPSPNPSPNLNYPSEIHDHKIENLLVCVNYPGNVQNTSKAIETLGGIEEVSNVLANKKSKMELRFRPSNVFCHKINGERSNSTGMLIKVRAKKKTRQIMGVTIEGIVETEYKFGGMGDFAYLPVQRDADGVTRSRYEALVPSEEVVEPSYLTDNREEVLFLPPPLFSRTENPHIDVFRREMEESKGEDGTIIRTVRSARKVFGTCIAFSLDNETPQRAKADAYDSVKLRLVNQDKINHLKGLFQQRPIWIKSALLEASGYGAETVKLVLPVIAYYYTIGPWRTCWVRFGYDPRRDFGARFYQIIDYRVRKYGNIREFTERKPGRGKDRKFASSKFDESTMPKFNLIFYQYCDIHIAQVQKMLEKIAAPAAGGQCNEKRGWLPMGFEEQVREIMSEIVQRNYRNMSQKEIEDVSINDPDEDYDEEDSDSEMEIDEPATL